MQNTEKIFYRIPPEIWEKVVCSIGRRDLAALALSSRNLYPHANMLLYSVVELSFCKCSDTYYQRLARTLLGSPELSKRVTNLLVDMKIVCRVKGLSSLENMKDTVRSTWQRHMQAPFNAMLHSIRPHKPSRETEWNKEAVQTLRGKHVAEILSCLTCLNHITVILGRFDQEDDILPLIFARIPEESMRRIQYLRLNDALLKKNRSLMLLTSLSILDIGFTSVTSAELWAVLRQNAHTLERLSLHWVVESNQLPLFTDCSGVELTNLKAFSTKGPHSFSSDALMELLGGCVLEELGMESLAAPAAQHWASLLEFLSVKVQQSRRLHTIKLGIATGCTSFWESAAKLINCCSDQLKNIWINGSSRGPSGRFPVALHNCFVYMQEQKNLSSYIVIWRDDFGVDESLLETLQGRAQTIELLHIYIRFPLEKEVDRLLELTKSFVRLRALHFVFPTRATDGDWSYQAAVEKLNQDIRHNNQLFDEWTERASKQHICLQEVSWSTYNRMEFSLPNPSIYKMIDRSRNTYIDIGREYREFQTSRSFTHRCTVGSKKVLLHQKPSWREDMGNPFLEGHRVCPYAEFPSLESTTKRLVREL